MGKRVLTKTLAVIVTATVLVGCVGWPVAKRMKDRAFQAPPGMVAIEISTTRLPLTEEDPEETRVGSLIYRGGLHLKSPDRRFGGLSGLIVSGDGKKLLAISDRAYWFWADLVYEKGRLVGVQNGTLAPILDEQGNPLKTPRYDSEGLTVDSGDPFDPDSEGTVLVSFETKDRVARFAFGRDGGLAKSEPIAMPAGLKKSVGNKGLEGITKLADGSLLAITERTLDENGNAVGWLIAKDGTPHSITLRRTEPYELTDLARGPDGDVFALERRFSFIGGPGMRIRQLAAASIKPGAVLDGPVLAELDIAYSIDNMEGLSIRRAPNGGKLFYLIADNNLLALQRTVLLMFEMPSKTPPKS